MDGPLPLDEAIDLAFELAAELVQHLKQDKRKHLHEVQRPYEAFCGPEVGDLSEAESDVISKNSTPALSILSDRSPTTSGPSTSVVQDAGSIPELSIPLSSPSYHQEGIVFSKTRTEQLGKEIPRSMGSNMVRGSETNRQSTVGLTGNDKIADLECVARPPPEIDKNDELPDQGDSTMEQASASSRFLPNRISISGDQRSTSSIGTRRTDIADSHNTATTRNFHSHNTTTKTHPKTLNNSHNVTYNYVTHHHCPAHMGIMVSVLLSVTLSWILLQNGMPSLHEARSRL